MKRNIGKILYFIAGIIFTIIASVSILYYYYSDRVSYSTGSDRTEKISDDIVEKAIIDKKIEPINFDEYDQITKSFSDKTLVTFWASWCGSCLKEIPILQEYAIEKNLDLVFVNFDKQNIRQNKVVLEKMKNLNIDKTFQFADEKLVDPMNFRLIGSFLKERNIILDTLGLPVTIFYEKGINTRHFGPIETKEFQFKKIDEYLK